jgi:hypothetical protein
VRSLEVARAVNQSKHLRLVGVAGYEGLMPGTAIGEPAGLEAYVDSIAQTARWLNSASLFAAGRVPLVWVPAELLLRPGRRASRS